MREPAQPKQPGEDTGSSKPGKNRVAEFKHGQGRPKMHIHKISLESLTLPGVHKIPGRR
jgi:hypothetical protein